MKSTCSTFFVLLVLAATASFTTVNAQENPNDTLRPIETNENSIPTVVFNNLYSLDVPEGFIAMDSTKQSYLNKNLGAVVQVVEIENVNLVNLRMGFDEAYFKENNLTKISEHEFRANNGAGGVIFKSSFSLQGEQFIRYSAITGGLSSTAWVNFTYLEKMDIVLEAEVLKCFNSIRLNPAK